MTSKFEFKSLNYLTFNVIAIAENDREAKYPKEYYEDVENFGLTDDKVIAELIKNKGYVKSVSNVNTIKYSISRDGVIDIQGIVQCIENPGWTNILLPDDSIITVLMEHDDVIEYIDDFIFLLNDLDENDDKELEMENQTKTTRNAKVQTKT